MSPHSDTCRTTLHREHYLVYVGFVLSLGRSPVIRAYETPLEEDRCNHCRCGSKPLLKRRARKVHKNLSSQEGEESYRRTQLLGTLLCNVGSHITQMSWYQADYWCLPLRKTQWEKPRGGSGSVPQDRTHPRQHPKQIQPPTSTYSNPLPRAS